MTWEWVVLIIFMSAITVSAFLFYLDRVMTWESSVKPFDDSDFRTFMAAHKEIVETHTRSIEELKKFQSEMNLAKSLRVQR